MYPTNNKFEKINQDWYKEVDSKKQFLKYGTISTVMALFSNFPKLLKNDQEIQELKSAHNLLALQKLETILYRDGVAALQHKTFMPARVIDYVELNGKLVSLIVEMTFLTKNGNITAIEKYEYDSDNNLVFKWNINKDPRIKDNEAIKMLKIHGYEPRERKEIPFTLFYNNPLKIGDLELINGEYFELLNRDIKVLLEDGFLSAPWLIVPTSQGIDEMIQKGRHDLSRRTLSINPHLFVNLNIPVLSQSQGNSQAQILIEKIEKNVSWIKKWGFFKVASSDLGTKNLHNIEAQELNSDYEDYLESKANLRELQLLEFFKASGLDVDNVLVFGSTKYNKEIKHQENEKINNNLLRDELNNEIDKEIEN